MHIQTAASQEWWHLGLDGVILKTVVVSFALEIRENSTHSSDQYFGCTQVPESKTCFWLDIRVDFSQHDSVDFVACSSKPAYLNWLHIFQSLLHHSVKVIQRTSNLYIVVIQILETLIKRFDILRGARVKI